MTLPAYYFRCTPEEIALRHERDLERAERACGDCQHRAAVHIAGVEYLGCSFKHRKYGKRCDLYSVKKVDKKG